MTGEYAFLADIKASLGAERNVDDSVTPEQAEKFTARYPKDMPEGYKLIDPAEFFDGAP